MDLYKVLGPGGVDFPAFFAVLREGNYDGWIMLDYTAEVYAAFNSPAGAQPLIPASDPGRVCHHKNRQQGFTADSTTTPFEDTRTSQTHFGLQEVVWMVGRKHKHDGSVASLGGGWLSPDRMPWCANPDHPCSNGGTSNRPSLAVRWAGICDSPFPRGTSRHFSPSGASPPTKPASGVGFSATLPN